jgi:hypothetical protein
MIPKVMTARLQMLEYWQEYLCDHCFLWSSLGQLWPKWQRRTENGHEVDRPLYISVWQASDTYSDSTR